MPEITARQICTTALRLLGVAGARQGVFSFLLGAMVTLPTAKAGGFLGYACANSHYVSA